MMRGSFAAAAALMAFAAAPLVLPTYQVSVATQVLIFAMLAMSVDILAGYAGRTSLGHGALFGTSAYVTVYWVTVGGGSPWAGAGLGILAATALAAVFALLAIRTSARCGPKYIRTFGSDTVGRDRDGSRCNQNSMADQARS